MKVSFYLHNQLDTTGRAAIYCRYSHESKEFRFPLKYENDGGIIRIQPDDWIKNYNDLQAQIKKRIASRKDQPFRVRLSNPLSQIINIQINKTEKEIYSICNDLLVSGKMPFCSEVKIAYQSRNKKINIWDLYDEFLKYKKKSSKKHTFLNFKYFERELILLNEAHPIKINRLGIDYILRFRDFFAQRGNSISSIRVKMVRLKTFLNWAHEREYISNDKFKRWRLENQKAIRHALTVQEIERIRNVDLPDELDIARNVLLFSCFTGMRKGEINSLSPLSERNGIIQFQTGKVKGKIKVLRSVKLNELSSPYWDKIKDLDITYYSRHTQQMKEVAKLAGINDIILNTRGERKPKYSDVSFNTGRISFITLSYQFGIPKNFISLIAGHARLTMTDHYDKTEIQESYSYMDLWKDKYFSLIA